MLIWLVFSNLGFSEFRDGWEPPKIFDPRPRSKSHSTHSWPFNRQRLTFDPDTRAKLTTLTQKLIVTLSHIRPCPHNLRLLTRPGKVHVQFTCQMRHVCVKDSFSLPHAASSILTVCTYFWPVWLNPPNDLGQSKICTYSRKPESSSTEGFADVCSVDSFWLKTTVLALNNGFCHFLSKRAPAWLHTSELTAW